MEKEVNPSEIEAATEEPEWEKDLPDVTEMPLSAVVALSDTALAAYVKEEFGDNQPTAISGWNSVS